MADIILLVGAGVSLIAVVYYGRHIIPKGSVMLFNDIRKLKLMRMFIRIFQRQIQEGDYRNEPNKKENS